jgi:hypothetical protein
MNPGLSPKFQSPAVPASVFFEIGYAVVDRHSMFASEDHVCLNRMPDISAALPMEISPSR